VINDPILEKFCNSVLKEFMMTPIDVLYSNFTEIGRQEVDEMMHCFSDKKFMKCGFCHHFAPVWQRAPSQEFAGEHTTLPRVSCIISCQSVPVCRSYSGKSNFGRSQYVPSAYKDSYLHMHPIDS